MVSLDHDSGVLWSTESDLCSGLLDDCWEIHSLLHFTSMSCCLRSHQTDPVNGSCVGDGEERAVDDYTSWYTEEKLGAT